MRKIASRCLLSDNIIYILYTIYNIMYYIIQLYNFIQSTLFISEHCLIQFSLYMFIYINISAIK